MKPVRDPHWLRFIRSLPCSVPGCRLRNVEAAHTGIRGIGQRATDYNAIPLCKPHHWLWSTSYHALGRRKFEQVHQISIRTILERLHRKPAMRLQSGEFVAMFDGEEFRLGSASQGAEAAMRKFRKIRMEMAS
jgi:hypothetical protein